MPRELPPLWQCPKCGKTFITKNIWHSCTTLDLESLFAGCQPHVFPLYQKFEAMVRACGPITINPGKSGIAMQVRVRCMGCVPRKAFLRVGFAFAERREHPRFYKIEAFSKYFIGHYIRVYSEDELDADVEQWIRDAYAVGEQRRLMRSDADE
jgi:hypothetical protein